MKNVSIKRLTQLGLAVIGAYVVSGAPSSSATSNIAASRSTSVNGALASETVDQSSTEVSVETLSVDFEVCAAVDDWQRPAEDEQAKHLGKDPRYGDMDSNDALKRSSAQFWEHQAVSFTTYGLSARMEPVTLSGLWTVTDELWDCYEPETTVAINEGELAETWLFNQRITGLQQVGDRYVMTVESAPTGVQVVQFDRSEQLAELPLDIVNASGESIPVASGDWQ